MDITATATHILNSTPVQYTISALEALMFSIGVLLTGEDSEPEHSEEAGPDNEEHDTERIVYSPDSLFF